MKTNVSSGGRGELFAEHKLINLHSDLGYIMKLVQYLLTMYVFIDIY